MLDKISQFTAYLLHGARQVLTELILFILALMICIYGASILQNKYFILTSDHSNNYANDIANIYANIRENNQQYNQQFNSIWQQLQALNKASQKITIAQSKDDSNVTHIIDANLEIRKLLEKQQEYLYLVESAHDKQTANEENMLLDLLKKLDDERRSSNQ